MNRFLALFLLGLALIPHAVFAQSRATGTGFDLTATDGIRYIADAGRYEASGDVQLVVGAWVVLADQVVAVLDGPQDQIDSLTATGTVFVQNESFKARADALELRLSDPLVTLRGEAISVQMGDERLMTQRRLTYAVKDGTLTIPQAFVLQVDGAVIAGGEAALVLADGGMQALHVDAGVDIERDDFRAAAEQMDYAPIDAKIVLSGAVVLQSGDVLLSGASAVFDLKTGAVQISNDTSQRVSGALLPQ